MNCTPPLSFSWRYFFPSIVNRSPTRQLNLRFANAAEPEFQKWIQNNPANDFDRSILHYPTLKVFCAYDAESRQPVAYLPVQQALVLESTAIRPELNAADSAQALRDMVKASQLIASSQGIREIFYFGTKPEESMGREERLNAMAARHNFTHEKDWKIFRMRVQ